MKCPVCESQNVRVSNVRERDSKVYRRRKCLDCGEVFTTYELDCGMLMEVFEGHFNLETSQKIATIIERSFPVRSRLRD